MSTKRTVQFPVFVDDQGNHFVFPNIWYGEGTERTSANQWGTNRLIEVALRVREEKTPLSVEVIDNHVKFPHVATDAISRGFKHGADKVWLISGPVFESFMKETENGATDTGLCGDENATGGP